MIIRWQKFTWKHINATVLHQPYWILKTGQLARQQIGEKGWDRGLSSSEVWQVWIFHLRNVSQVDGAGAVTWEVSPIRYIAANIRIICRPLSNLLQDSLSDRLTLFGDWMNIQYCRSSCWLNRIWSWFSVLSLMWVITSTKKRKKHKWFYRYEWSQGMLQLDQGHFLKIKYAVE